MKKNYFVKGAGVLLIVAALIFSSVAINAETANENAISLISNPTQNWQLPIETSGRAILWDQYDTDGSNGLSHADVTAIGYQRALLDDFEIPAGETWILTDLHSLNLWNTMQPGVGTNFHLEFWSDNAGAPGSLIVTATTASYTETATGRTWFSRPEFEIEYIYEPIVLGSGVYWIYAFVIGPENCFWMAKQDVIWGSECWTDYQDIPPMGPGSIIFGAAYDLAFQLTGELEQPAVPAICCEGDLNWVDVPAGGTVTGQFDVCNCGEEGSLLDYEVVSWPEWGNWTIDPITGTGIMAGDCVTITVTVVAPPEKKKTFTGSVKIINLADPDDFCEIDVSLTTPRARYINNPFFLRILERFENIFAILKILF